MTRTLGTPTPIAVRRSLRRAGERLQAWRKLRGLTQAQVADRAGIDRRTLRNLENGDGGVSFEVALRVFNALGILDGAVDALDPYATDLGRLRAEEQLPQRVRPRKPGGRPDAKP